jgi:hypothetical protein
VAGTWEMAWNRSLEGESMSRRCEVPKKKLGEGCLIKKKPIEPFGRCCVP